MKIDCAPLFWGILQPERSVFLHAQTVHLPVLWAVRIHHRVQPVLDGPAQSPLPCRLSLPVPDPGSEAPPSSAADLAAQAMPELAAQSYRLCDKGGRVAVYRCGTNGQPDVLVTVTGIYTNLLPENDAVRIKRGVTVYSERELDLLLEDLGD